MDSDNTVCKVCCQTMKCPKCGTECEPYAEVDIGVGVMQGGPWGCPACHWVEPDDDSLHELEDHDFDPYEAAGESRFGLPGGGHSL